MALQNLKKLFIANRGEIAARIDRTAARFNLPTLHASSVADIASLPLRAPLSRSTILGSTPSATDSYLDIGAIRKVLGEFGVDAVHPGYGFLSESPTFARALEDDGIRLLGPPASAMLIMGDKARAKETMRSAGVPVVPGYEGGSEQRDSDFHEAAATLGFPLLLKAVAGGGGKGMRIVRRADELQEALDGARREGVASFGLGDLIMERYVERPRHVEVQVFADSHGNAVYLYDRDCSVQRRYQKVIEEAPAPGLSATQRAAMGEAAVAAALAVGYRGAGTVEFILDADAPRDETTGDLPFYFMEMNTRLQVEHPVTELVTGLDLVEWQLRIADGQPLPLAQHEVPLLGHAFEARLYAEDPHAGYLPQSGHIDLFRVPATASLFENPPSSATKSEEVTVATRVDHAMATGLDVTSYYDPMIGKALARGPDRATALAALSQVVGSMRVVGPPTNLGLIRGIAANAAFQQGEVDTKFLEEYGPQVLAAAQSERTLGHVAVAVAALAADALANRSGGSASPWHARGAAGFRPGLGAASTTYVFDEGVAEVRARDAAVGTFELRWTEAGESPDAAAWQQLQVHLVQRDEDGLASVQVTVAQLALVADHFAKRAADGTVVHRVWLAGDAADAVTLTQAAARAAGPGGGTAAAGNLVSPMPGTVTKVLVEDGQSVAEGEALVIVEAMKMEHTLRAPTAGVVRDLAVFVGDLVPKGKVVATVVSADAE